MSGDVEHTILFVDDEPWLSEALRLSLEARGFVCISKRNMTDAWAVLEKQRIDVVVTDIMMPAGDGFPSVDSSSAGFHLVRRIRQQWPKMAIICLSVIADIEKIEELKRQNILYLRKGETPLETAVKLIQSKATGIMSF
jgi:DNA-binding response OmpR family regulator